MLKVVVLYNLLERLQKGEEKDILAEDGILEEIGAVEEAIQGLGSSMLRAGCPGRNLHRDPLAQGDSS